MQGKEMAEGGGEKRNVKGQLEPNQSANPQGIEGSFQVIG